MIENIQFLSLIYVDRYLLGMPAEPLRVHHFLIKLEIEDYFYTNVFTTVRM